MREVKFRAWHRKLNEWHYWRLLDLPGMETQTQMVGGQAMKISKIDYTNWCEYTGLNDKAKNEIYEGDIMRRFTGYIFEVRMNLYSLGKGTCAFGYQHEISDEIIGNVYENPKLLNQGEGDERSVATKINQGTKS